MSKNSEIFKQSGSGSIKSSVTQNFHGPVYGVAGTVEGNQVINIQSQQELSDAIAETQLLLKGLRERYPSNKTTEKLQIAVKAIEQIEKNPTLKHRLIAAAKCGGLEVLKSFPIGAFVVEAIEGWLD